MSDTDLLKAAKADIPTTVKAASKKFEIPEDLLHKMVKTESGGNQAATSPKGAHGVMQLMPGTAKDLGVNINDPIENIYGGAKYLKQQKDKFGSWERALWAYNAGPGKVEARVMPIETRKYLKQIAGATPQQLDLAKMSNEELLKLAKQQGIESKPQGQPKQGGQPQIPPPRPVEGPLPPGARPPDMRNPQDLDAAVKQVDTIRNKPIAERLSENAKSAAPVTDTVLPIAGMVAGGLAATPTGPLGMVAGSALGYGAGRQAARAIREAGGETPERGAKPVIEAGKDLAEGALMEAGGQVAGKAIEGAASLTGKIAKPLLGRLTGTGTAAVDEALKSGESTGLFSGNPLKSKTMFDKALRGEISGDEVVDNAKEALGIVKDKRQAAYQTELKKVSSNKANIDTRPAWGKIQALMDRYGIKANPNGTFDTSRIAMGKAGRKDIADVLSTMKNWGKKPGDNTAMGLDTLKRQLDDFYSDSSQARQFVASMRNEVKDLIVKNVPEYGKMTKDYAEATKLIKDIESGLMMRKQGMSGRIVADQTLRRLTSAMRDNFSLRKDLVDALGGVSGKDIAGQVAGHSMSSLMPRGLAGTGPAVTSEIALAHFVHPGFWPVLVASSPRVTGEFLRMFGKGMAEARKLKPALRLLGPTGVAVKAKKEPGTEQEDPWREIGGDEY
jgi:hypothetical protein